MKVVVLGSRGLLGRALCASAPPQLDVTALGHADLDVRDEAAVQRAVRDASPAWVLNATAHTDVDGAEREPELARAVNATAVGSLAEVCAAAGAGLVHVSTDYVFAGDREQCYAEDDAVAPVNAYGASKEAGERLVRESGARHLIVRTQWVFGEGGRAFLSTLADRARARTAIRVVDDEFGACTYAADLARAMWALLGRAEGTVHIANRGRVSRYDVARRIYAAFGAGDLVSGVRSSEVPMTARRPRSSQLCLDKVEELLGRPMPSWTDAVDRYLAAERA